MFFKKCTAYGIRTHDFQDENLASWTELDERGNNIFRKIILKQH